MSWKSSTIAIFKPLLIKHNECTLHFWKLLIFFYLDKRGQELSCMFSLWYAIGNTHSLTSYRGTFAICFDKYCILLLDGSRILIKIPFHIHRVKENNSTITTMELMPHPTKHLSTVHPSKYHPTQQPNQWSRPYVVYYLPTQYHRTISSNKFSNSNSNWSCARQTPATPSSGGYSWFSKVKALGVTRKKSRTC